MRRIRALTYVLAAILLTACGSDAGTNPAEETLSGTFLLQSVNGNGLPFSTEDEGAVVTLNSASIAFQLNGTFNQSTSTTVTQAGQTLGPASVLLAGTFVYVASTHAVSLRSSDGAQIAGTVLNNTMTLQDDGDTYVFNRQ